MIKKNKFLVMIRNLFNLFYLYEGCIIGRIIGNSVKRFYLYVIVWDIFVLNVDNKFNG